VMLEDGGFLVAGNTTSFGENFSKAYIIRTNSLGDIIWEKIISPNNQPTFAKKLKITASGEAVLAADVQVAANRLNVYFAQIDINSGDFSGRLINSSGSERVNDFIEAIDVRGGFYAVGSTTLVENPTIGNSTDFRLWKLNANFVEIISSTYGFPFEDYAVSICYAPAEGMSSGDGSLMVLGLSLDNPQEGLGKRDFLVAKFNFNFGVLGQKAYGGKEDDFPNKIIRSGGSSHVIFGNSNSETPGNQKLLIGTISSSLTNFSGGRRFADSAFVELGSNFRADDFIIRANDRNIAVVGTSNINGSDDIVFGLLSPTFELDGRQDDLTTFGNGATAANDRGGAITVFPNGQFGIVGTSATGNFGNSNKIILIKTNSSGGMDR
jgi:hypothetical protein